MICHQTRFSVATDTHRGYHIVLDVSSAMVCWKKKLAVQIGNSCLSIFKRISGGQ